MFAGSNMARLSYGEVGVEVNRGKIRLRLPRYLMDKGVERYIYTGMDDSRDNKFKAETLALSMTEDLRTGCFDLSLTRYKNALNPRIFLNKNISSALDLRQLWTDYALSRKRQVAGTTYKMEYETKFPNHIKQLPTFHPEDAIAHRDYLIENLSLGQARRVITQLSACCDWAMEEGMIHRNPYKGMAEKIKAKIRIPGEEDSEIDPFSDAERIGIEKAFEFHEEHNHFYPFIRFLNLTGCRPSEAIGLKKEDILRGFTQIIFRRSYSTRVGIEKDTKNHGSRRFQVNQSLKELLTDIVPLRASDDYVIFKAKKGGYIRQNQFVQRVWKGYHPEGNPHGRHYIGITESLLSQGIMERYRPPYNLRHTAITRMVEEGVSLNHIAYAMGNSAAVIEKYYMGRIMKFTSPLD
ncbi:tyrosine-type recombinase/integrase [Chroococcidiopsis sp.]|uniref:tyrosine-type recombinase/integrase n=1 Tax=Chroococcidiopsis sp. TaxID=3088168 RepID=UPI003F3C703A